MITVIVAEDDHDARSILIMMLSAYPELEVVAEVDDGDAALAAVLEHLPEVIFLDIDMPGKSGLEVAKAIQGLNLMPYIVFVTGRREYALEAFDLEASDYIVKPAEKSRLDKCVERLLERIHTKKQHQTSKDLAERVEKLEVATMTDPLLHVYNRRFMEEQLQISVGKCQKHGAELACVMLDLDHFKSVNDTHGHQVGDMVLVQLCTVIKGRLRPDDLLARYGGEEFLVLLHDSNRDTASAVAERIREAIEKYDFGKEDNSFKLTASLGISCFQQRDTPTTLVERADAALYEAKRSGRNQALLV